MRSLALVLLLTAFSLNVFAQEDPTGWKQAKKIEQQLYALDAAADGIEEFRNSQQNSTLVQVIGVGLISTSAALSGNPDNSRGASFLAITGGVVILISWIIDRASYKKLEKVEDNLRKAAGNSLPELPELYEME